MNLNVNFPHLIMLVVLGLLGGIAIYPYSTALRPEITLTTKMIILSVVQSLITMIFIAWIGLKSADALGMSIFSPPGKIWIAVASGLFIGFLILTLDKFIFAPHLPAAFTETATQISLWKRFLACFYGGITEELLMRWFLLSGTFWLLSRFWTNGEGAAAVGAFWIANIIVALLFGLGHLPATAALAKLSPLLISRALILNGAGGIVFGVIFWKYGLFAAMVSHFSADIVLHVISSLLQAKQ
jgi:membrane protease YdiL (CAAX protease family)